MDTIEVQCPYCFQWVELALDPELRGEAVQDCEVCCHPWVLHVERDEDGAPTVTIERAQD